MLRYRADIDGLRTVAVAPVVLYHLGVPPFTGGFVGVDVFFVISGFLITSVILADLDAGLGLGPLLIGFYDRRIRRILPALAVVLAFTTVVGSWLLLPLDLRDLGRSTLATALFVSNIYFWLSSGYFDAPAHLKPLLHTWSLAVEEQFYVVFPPLAFALVRLGRRRARLILKVLALCSFGVSVWLAWASPNGAFYLPQSRAWELLLGSLLAFSPQVPGGRRAGEVATAAGLGLIVASILVINDEWPFPGAAALAPCGGALLVIYGGLKSTAGATRLLSTAPMVWIGKRSYSLYLWHWPLIVFTRYWLVRDLTGWEATGLAALSLLMADLSYRFVEAPFRRRGLPKTWVFAGAAATSLAFAGLGFVGHVTNGLPWRFPAFETPPGPETYYACLLDDPRTFKTWREAACRFNGPTPDEPTVALWGDSYAAHYLPGLRALQDRDHFSIVQLTSAGCPPFLNHDEPKRRDCREFGDDSAAWLIAHPPALVIIAVRWNRYRDPNRVAAELKPSLDLLRSAHIPVLIVGESPFYAGPVPQILQILDMRGRPADRLKPLNAFDTDGPLERMAKAHGDAFFSPHRALCDADGCRLTVDGQPIHWDEGHLSVAGSRFLAAQMEPQIEALLNRRPAD